MVLFSSYSKYSFIVIGRGERASKHNTEFILKCFILSAHHYVDSWVFAAFLCTVGLANSHLDCQWLLLSPDWALYRFLNKGGKKHLRYLLRTWSHLHHPTTQHNHLTFFPSSQCANVDLFPLQNLSSNQICSQPIWSEEKKSRRNQLLILSFTCL
jgi:hypothetical protein